MSVSSQLRQNLRSHGADSTDLESIGEEVLVSTEKKMTAMLAAERCAICRKDSPRVTAGEISELKPFIPEWELVEIDGVPRLERTFRFKTYRHALAFTQRVGEAAIEDGHHPVIVTEPKQVRVTWWTHAISGLHRNDFIMAAKTDKLFETEETSSS